ncbi:MAG: phosphoglycerate dehydrogenase [Chitinophagales bacterium]
MKVFVSATSFGQGCPEVFTRLAEAGCEVSTNPYGRPLTESELIQALAGADGFIAGVDRITANVLAETPQLKVISRYGVGVDGVDLAAATAHRIVVANTPGANTESVADLAFGLFLALARRIPLADREVKGGKWPRLTGFDVWGQTVAVLGTGQIGRAVARRAKAFGMEILGYDVQRHPEIEQLGGTYVSLEEALARADFVTLHLPLLPQTRGIIGRDQLALMKPTAFLVNTSRGGIVDEDALYEALTAGRLAGAGLDVYATEPPSGSKLVALENVIATPHSGAHTFGAMRRMAHQAVDNLLAVLKGERPAAVANPEVYA